MGKDKRGYGKVAIDLSKEPPFGRLRAIAIAGVSHSGRTLWKCLCDCGAEKIVRAADLRSGRTKSCGCLARELRLVSKVTHGESGKTPEYKAWVDLIYRCENPKNNRYQFYGGKGIAVCERWRSSFENFLADMGRKPSKSHSIDRIDNDRGYEPANCCWADKKQQSRNRSCVVLIEKNGIKKCMAEWSEETGIPLGTIWWRINRLHWSHVRSITEPVDSSKRNKRAVNCP